MLVSREVVNKWPSTCLRALPRYLSDHKPLLLILNDINFGARPFRFFSSWLDRPDFDSVVKNAVESFVLDGPPDVKLMLKFRWIRQHISKWREEIRKKEGESEEKCLLGLEDLDKLVEERDLTEEEDRIKLECKNLLAELELFKLKDLRQKSRSKWAMDGDDITKKKKFTKSVEERPTLECNLNYKLSEVEANALVSPFSVEEIKAGVFECGDDRAPGPNGLISRGCSSSFITLVSKVKDPVKLNEFRLINLVGVNNKVLSKVLLANRLKKVLHLLISNSQTAFLKDRVILNGPLILNEVISWVKRKVQWCNWIYGILSTSRSLVLVDGSPTFEFPCFKGMRQGDPISPFLFLRLLLAW
ncbi:uncharacterized protein LOC110919205 [Helianthus annuus]|uniref:uncharacterized protein LOC110919205 n=1 Tax=Helianthus annuus TaxID=4232 RepID=UPI001652C094|nr:uncharacterized protein LOC110919205 [Helianthus annuus]